MRSRKIRGIFPKNYVALKECHVDKITTVEEVIPKEPAIIKEITAVSGAWQSGEVKQDEKEEINSKTN